MIRTATLADVDDIVGLAVATEMFAPDHAPFLEQTLREHFGAGAESSQQLIVDTDTDESVVGSTLWQPRPAADRVWEVTMIAVAPRSQGRGRGAAMMRMVEGSLRDLGQRLVIVETSATAQYDRTRDFYSHLGYVEQGRVQDYWEAGDDLAIFSKAL